MKMSLEMDSSSRIQCSLCLENFKDPRILMCFHSFCHDCLAAFITTKGVQPKTFSCPLCRTTHKLPKEGVAGLQKNFYLEDTCVDKSTQNIPKVPQPAFGSHPACDVHPNEDLRFYCHNCSHAICRDCKIISHEGHKIDMIHNVFKEMIEKVEKSFNDTEKVINEKEQHVHLAVNKEIDNISASIKDNVEQCKDYIDNFGVLANELMGRHIHDMRRYLGFCVRPNARHQREKIEEFREKLSDIGKLTPNNESVKALKELLQKDVEL